MGETWIVVAESSRARIYTRRRRHSELQEREDLVHPESRLHERELTSDLPGRAFDSGGEGRHALTERSSPKEHEAKTFAKELARHLETERSKNGIDKLILMAPPHFLGLLRDALSKSCRDLVAGTVDKNLVYEDVEVIRRHASAWH